MTLVLIPPHAATASAFTLAGDGAALLAIALLAALAWWICRA